jgi:hypothetical protein
MGLIDVPGTALWKGDAIVRDVSAKSGYQDAVAMLPAVSNSRTPPAAPSSPRLAPNTRLKHTGVSPGTQRPSGIRQESCHQDLSGIGTFLPAPVCSRRPSNRIYVLPRTQKSSSSLKDQKGTARLAAATLKTSTLAE